MKTKYIKPSIEVIMMKTSKRIMMSNSEPEVTYNIGANSSVFDTDDENENILWGD